MAEGTLIERLAKIRKIADVVSKDKQGFGYSYADINEILAKVTAGMNKYDISLIPCIVPGTLSTEQLSIVSTKRDKAGNSFDSKSTETLVRAEMVFKWVCNDNPDDNISVPWIVIGSQGDPSQAFGSALTYCTRYFLTTYFNIAQTKDDVDEYRSRQKEAEAAEEKAVLQGLIGQIDTAVRTYLTDNADKKQEIQKFIAPYAPKSDYTAIKDVSIAAKLLNDFRAAYVKEEE